MSQAAAIGNLFVNLTMNSAEFVNGVRSVQGSLSGLVGSLKAFAGAAALQQFGSLAVDAIKAVAEIGDVAESIGVTAEQLQVFQKMAIASGASTDVLVRGLQSIAEQSVQSGSALEKLFSANGMALAGKDTNQIILEFMDLLKNARTPAEQLAIATEVLGDKVGRQLVEAFREGALGVDEATKEMVASGEFHTNEEVKRLQRLETEYNKVTDRIAVYWQKMIVNMVEGASRIQDEWASGKPSAASELLNWITGGQVQDWNITTGDMINAPRTSGFGTTGGPNEFASPPVTTKQNPTKRPPPDDKKTKEKKTATVKYDNPFDTLQSEGRGVWDTTRTSVEKYQTEIRKLNDLLRVGVIDNDTYSRAVKQLQDGFTEAAPEAVNFGQALLGIADSIASGLSDALTGLITGTMSAKEAFAQMAQSIIQSLSDIAAELVRSGILKLLSGVLGGMAGGGGAGFNIGGMMFGGVYANGGYLGSGKWGIAGEAGPEIIHGPARITPMDKMGGGNGVNVTVINNTPARVNTRQGADGGLTIEVVEEAVATAISRGGNKIDSAMQRGFGLRRAGR